MAFSRVLYIFTGFIIVLQKMTDLGRREDPSGRRDFQRPKNRIEGMIPSILVLCRSSLLHKFNKFRGPCAPVKLEHYVGFEIIIFPVL